MDPCVMLNMDTDFYRYQSVVGLCIINTCPKGTSIDSKKNGHSDPIDFNGEN